MRRIAIACTALAVLLPALAATPAHAGPAPTCGETITADTVLQGDLTCSGTALVIGSDGVALDLAGHTVVGAIVAGNVSDPRVRGGVVRGDVRLDRVRRASVRRLRVRGGSIACIRSAGCALVQNHVTGGGIAVVQSENGIPNRIRRNRVRGAAGPGIAADRTDTISITDNVVRASAIGIETSHAADMTIARNVLVRNPGGGLSGSFGSAASIVRNLIARNGGHGISLRTWGGETRIAYNIVRGNRGNGILGAAVAHWSVVGNLAAHNSGTGLAIVGAVEDTTLARNRARFNGGTGIDAAAGVTDGGGNRAHANAGVQCAGIACG
jgi:parallel beta helix pectate lyase-like protein